MKILFLGEPSSPNTISWVEGLRKQGCEVLVASVRTDGADGTIAIGNPIFPPRIRILTGVKHLKQIISQEKPDMLLAYRITSYGYLAAKTGFHPLVLAAQNEQIVYLPKPSFLRQKFLGYCAKFAIDKADLIHAWAKNITDGLIQFGADKDKILTLHRGIDMEVFKSLEPQMSEQKKKRSAHIAKAPVFVSTRTLAPEYLISDLLDAFKLVLDQIPEAKLEIAGSGTEESALKQQVQTLNIAKSVTFHGKINKEKLINLLIGADIYISLIQTDGISSSLLEGIATFLLPIVADMPASRAILTNKTNAILFSDGAIGQIAEKMIEASSSYEKMLPALEINKQKIMKNYERDGNQQIFLEKYSQLISGNQLHFIQSR